MGQDNTIYKFSIKLSFLSKGKNNSKLQKQISIYISVVTMMDGVMDRWMD